MNRATDYHLKPALEIPSLSLQAWDSLLETIPLNPESESLKHWAGFRFSTLPGWEKIAASPNDTWVFQYEKLQETLAKTQRKKGQPQEGVFYTAPAVARYLTVQTLGKFLIQARDKIYQAVQQKKSSQSQALAQALWLEVQQTRVIDPSCGTGVFLVEALHLFSAFYREVAQEIPELQLPHPAHFALTNQLAGIDLDPMSVMITEFRLAQWAVRLDEVKVTLDVAALSFYSGDTLGSATCGESTDPLSVGSNFANPKRSQKWQFILGNPPYVSEVRGQAQRFRKLQHIESPYYQAKMDLCDGFLAWAIDHLQPDGQLAYVLPAYWTQRSSTATLRSRLWEEGQLVETWAFEGKPLFKNAPGHHTALLIWQKNELNQSESSSISFAIEGSREVLFGHGESDADLRPENLKMGWVTLENKTGKFLSGDAVELTLLAKLSTMPPLLLPDEIQQGLVIPQGRLKPIDRARLPQAVQADFSAEPGVFVLNSTEVQALDLTEAEQGLLRPYYRPKGFTAFQGFLQAPAAEQIIYTDLKNRKALESNPAQYARLRLHLDRFATVNTSGFGPYGLHRSRQAVWFDDVSKILAPRQVLTPAFAVVPFSAYVNEGFLILRSPEDPQWLCALLNSQLAWFWFYHQKRKGVRLQIDKEVLNHFPKPSKVSSELRAQCIVLAQQLASSNSDLSTRKVWMAELNGLVAQAYQLTPVETAWLVKAQAAILPVAHLA